MPIKSPAIAAKPPTLEELRVKHELGTIQRAAIEAREFQVLDVEAKLLGNAAKRQGTSLANALKALMTTENMRPEDALQVDATAFRWDTAEADKIDPDAFVRMFEEGRITRAQLVESINVVKADAERIVGAHVLIPITKPTRGKEAGLRVERLDAPVKAPVIFRKGETAKAQVKAKPTAEEPVRATGSTKRAGTLTPLRRRS